MRNIFICALAGMMCLGAGIVGRAQTAPSDLSPDVQEVLTLSRQHMDDSVITNYIISTGKAYKLSADDIIYLNSQGVSQPVISALLSTAANSNANPATPSSTTPAAPTPAITPSATAAPATPPPLDENSPAPSVPAESTPGMPPPSQPMSAPPTFTPLQDNFFADGGLNPYWWQTESPLLSALAAAYGPHVLPDITFSPSGMQMSGISKHHQFMGVQSVASYSAPFSFSATVSGPQTAVPFQVYLVSGDLQQWLSVAGYLGGRPHPRGSVSVGLFGPFGGTRFAIPTGDGSSPNYGIWLNHTGSGWPISALGEKIFPYPVADVPYTIQVSVGGDGLASVTFMDPNHAVLGQDSVPVGTGPFYVVLAGRDGSTRGLWQSVQLMPASPPMSAPMPVVAEQPPVSVPPTPTLDYFQGQLAPYGTWINVPGYGLCWQPAVDPGWRPYYDGGHWEYTDAGYYWQSDYPWGDIAFHYGRWTYTAAGWVWVPGYDYAPSWVVWRHDDSGGYVGWAPLPPDAVFMNGGWYFHGGAVSADFDFGLGVNFFTFVGYDHFWAHDYRPFIVPHDRVVFVFGHSAIANHYSYEHGRFVNGGIPHDRMVAYTHHDFHPVPMDDLRHQEEQHNAMQRSDDIHNYRPGTPPHSTWNSGHGQSGSQHQGNGQNHQDQNGGQQH